MIDPAYFAGVLDSDGSFTATRNRRAGNLRGHIQQVYVQLTWVESPAARAVLEAVKERYGGSLSRYSGRGRNCRAVLRYTTNAKSAAAIIRDTLPHLRLKRAQAECCLRLIELGRPPSGASRYRRMPEAVWARREALLEEVQRLNAGR